MTAVKVRKTTFDLWDRYIIVCLDRDERACKRVVNLDGVELNAGQVRKLIAWLEDAERWMTRFKGM